LPISESGTAICSSRATKHADIGNNIFGKGDEAGFYKSGHISKVYNSITKVYNS